MYTNPSGSEYSFKTGSVIEDDPDAVSDVVAASNEDAIPDVGTVPDIDILPDVDTVPEADAARDADTIPDVGIVSDWVTVSISAAHDVNRTNAANITKHNFIDINLSAL